MAKKEKLLMSGGQLVARGDIITVGEGGEMVRCRVLSCIAVGNTCAASLEALEGPRKGEKFQATIKAAGLKNDTK
jgi:hypothetical protein